MNNTKMPLLVLGMAIATYTSRAIPVVLADKMEFGVKIEKYLKLIPYTVISALISLTVSSMNISNPAVGIAGGLVAGILAWRKYLVMVGVLAAIGADFILYCFL